MFGGSFGKEQGQFFHTHDVTIDSKGFVFVNDCLDNRILKFTTEGQFVSLFKSDIPFPSGITVNDNDLVYINNDKADLVQ